MTEKKSRDVIHSASNKGSIGYVIELCKVHLDSYPKDALVWAEYGEALADLSRFNEAEIAFDQAIALSKNDKYWQSHVFSHRGHLNQRRGNYAEAEKWFSKAIEAAPNLIWYHIFLGVILFRRGDLQLAEERLRKAIEVGGEETDEAYLNLGGVLMAQERYQEAQQCYLSAIELCPDYKLAKLRLRDVKKILALTK